MTQGSAPCLAAPPLAGGGGIFVCAGGLCRRELPRACVRARVGRRGGVRWVCGGGISDQKKRERVKEMEGGKGEEKL